MSYTLPTPGADYNTWGVELNTFLRSIVLNVGDYGAAGDGVTDDTNAINDALNTAGGAAGGIVFFPAGVYLTNGGHTIPVGVRVMGVRRTATKIINRGSTYTFRLMDETSGGAGCAIEHVEITGSTSLLSAVAGGIGLEISNGLRNLVSDVWIYGFTNSGIGIHFHSINGTIEYVEHNHLRNINIINCANLIKFSVGAGGGVSFGYNQLIDVQMQVYANQIAIEVASGVLYNSRIIGQLHYTGNNGTGIKVSGTGSVWQGTRLDIAGEMLSAYTGCLRIDNEEVFSAAGRFFIANGQPPDDYSAATTHQFVEETLTDVELPQTNLTAAATLTIPAGRDSWNVVGSTNISFFASQTSWEGRTVTLRFADTPTLIDSASFQLAGGTNFTASVDDMITMTSIAGGWYEVARSVN